MNTKKVSDAELFQQVLQRRDAVERLAKQAAVQPFSVATAEVRSIVAYANTDNNTDTNGQWIDEKVIQIPQGWAYFNHGWHETTALGEKKVYDPWVVRDAANASRIIEVHIKVQAFSRWFGRSWVGAQLDVTIVPLAALQNLKTFALSE